MGLKGENRLKFFYNMLSNCGRDSVGGIMTCYRLDIPGLKPWRGWDFLDPSRLTPAPNQPPVRYVLLLLFRGQCVALIAYPCLKCRGWVWVELYLYLPSVPASHDTSSLLFIINPRIKELRIILRAMEE